MADTRVVMMTPRLSRAMKEQLNWFEEKFGREPGPDDSVFFDPDSDVPIPLSEERLRADFLAVAKDAGFSEERSLEIFAALFGQESS